MTDVAAAPVALAKRAPLARPVGVVGRRSLLNGLFVLPYFVVFLVLMVLPLGVGIWLAMSGDKKSGMRTTMREHRRESMNTPCKYRRPSNPILSVRYSQRARGLRTRLP